MISCISLWHGSFTAGLGVLQYSMKCKAFQTILQNCIYLERCKLICHCEQHVRICVYEWRTKIRIRIFRLGKSNRDQIYYRGIIYEWDHWSWQCLKYIKVAYHTDKQTLLKKNPRQIPRLSWQLDNFCVINMHLYPDHLLNVTMTPGMYIVRHMYRVCRQYRFAKSTIPVEFMGQ